MEIISPIDKSNHEHDNVEFYDAFVDAEAPLMSTINVNNIDFQNQKTEEINGNNIYDDKGWIEFMSDLNRQMKENPEQFVGILDGFTASNKEFQLTTTDIVLHEDQSQMQHSIENNNRDIQLVQFDRLDDAWKNLIQVIHTNENDLIRRNVPRLILFSSDYTICCINCTLHMLLNAPVFIRLTRKLQKILQNSSNLRLIQNITHIENNAQAKINLFYTLSKIIEIAFEENQNDNTTFRLLRSFGDKYKTLYSDMNDWIQQDPDEFYTHLLNVLQLVAYKINQMELYSKAFEITSSVSINGKEPTLEKDHAIRDFPQYINAHYTSTVVEHVNGHIIDRKYGSLPEQLLATAGRQQNDNSVLYPYPTEFKTCYNQHYLFTGTVFFNNDHYIAVERRQDCVYLYNDRRLCDRFHINYLPTFFKTVHGRFLLYTEVDPLCEYVCTFEDPLPGVQAGEPYHEPSSYYRTEKLAISIPSNTSMRSTDVSPVIIRHPILSTFRYYMHSDFLRNNINTEIPTLNDCLDQNILYFWPRSMFAGFFIECTLIFKAPDGHFYRSHYEFVRNEPSGTKFENPTYFYIEKDTASNDEWFPLKLTTSKSKQNVLQSKNERSNEIDQDNQQNDTCQFVRYPDGKIEKIDQEKLLSFTKDENKKKKTNRRTLNNNSQKVTPFRVSKVVDLNTLYLALRRVRFIPDEKRYVPDSDVVFYSNAFKPVSSTVKKCQYDYSSDILQITELSPLQITLTNETDACTIQLSYIIPEMYKCTFLKDKYMRITILISTDEKPCVHPIYKILDKQNRVSSIDFPATEYSSTLTIIIVKYTINEFQKDSKLRQTLNNLSTTKQTIPSITQDSLQTIFTSPSMSSFRIQLELCHSSNDQLISYPKSTVISQIIIDESVSQEKQVRLEFLEVNNVELNDNLINQPSLPVKRSFDNEINVSSNISLIKCPKLV